MADDEIKALQESHATLQRKLDEQIAANTKLVEGHAAEIVALKAAHNEALKLQANQLAAQFATAMQKLKREVLAPIVKENHKRQQTELAAKQAAELKAIDQE
jgi:hypothetical protein